MSASTLLDQEYTEEIYIHHSRRLWSCLVGFFEQCEVSAGKASYHSGSKLLQGTVGICFLAQIHVFISPIRGRNLMMLVSRSEHHMRTFEPLSLMWTHIVFKIKSRE